MSAAGAAGTFRLGDLTVNRLGFGAMRLTGSQPFDMGVPRDRDASIAVLRRAVELGVDHIDTAAFYFSQLRSANELINTALSPYRDLVIVTKVGPGRDSSGEWLPMARPDQLRGQVEDNLRQLGRDHLDVVNFRTYGPAPVAEHVGALAELVQAGLVRHVGVSNVTPDQLTEARGVTDIVCVQNRHSVDEPRSDGAALLEECRRLGIAFVPFFAIAGSGREGGAGGTAEDPRVLAVARRRGVSPAQVRLAWTLSLGPHVLAIPGTGDLTHLEDNVAAASLELDAGDLDELTGSDGDSSQAVQPRGPSDA